MDKVISKFKFVYQYIISSIGFYPTLISLVFFLLSLFMLYLERHGLSQQMLESPMSFMIISHGETAGLILSSITTGIISLTVFSFTMVMLVLNQASTNFSPRVIPGLISHKSNQSVLGLYLGTLIYTLVIMVNIRSESYSASLPGFAIFLSMCFAIICLGFFVYFIHAISQSIQIGSILQDTYKLTLKQLEDEMAEDNRKEPVIQYDQARWYDLKSPRTGYLQSIDRKAVLRICRENDVILDFNAPLGNFIVEGVPFAQINKLVADEKELMGKLLDHLNFYREERPDLNYLFGFKHITESAVKALSPSINDPGTAIKAIEYLTALFAKRMQLSDEKVLCDQDGVARIRFKEDTFGHLFRRNVRAVRLYGKKDAHIITELLKMARNLAYKAKDYPHVMLLLFQESELIVADAAENISNKGDRAVVNETIIDLNRDGYFAKQLPLL